MYVIRNREDLDRNISQLASYLALSHYAIAHYARELVKRGICFVVTERDGKPFFSPSRFVGYRNNSISLHQSNNSKHGGETNRAISSVLGFNPSRSVLLDAQYCQFCACLGIIWKGTGSYGVPRKFWDALTHTSA